ncbi:MAG: hypothetical protein FWB75_00015 [Oscillospiraceae bacterium]|nr:hypothetical protein [Oscillospiraceae bacterium]
MSRFNWKKIIRSPKLWIKLCSIAVALFAYFGLSEVAIEGLRELIAIIAILLGYAFADECNDSPQSSGAATIVIVSNLEEALDKYAGEKAPLITNADDIEYNKDTADELQNGGVGDGMA